MAGTLADWERERFEQETSLEISELPEFEPERKSVPIPPVTDAEPCVLKSRTFAGWSTELGWHPALGVTITVKQGFDDTPYMFQVPPEKALDAFEHPYVYAWRMFSAAIRCPRGLSRPCNTSTESRRTASRT